MEVLSLVAKWISNGCPKKIKKAIKKCYITKWPYLFVSLPVTLLAWENDPQPTVIFMYSLEGNHPRTGHQWRILQAVNFTYIPRKDRKRFVKLWVETLNRTKNPKFTYQLLERKYPYLQIAVRRYFFKPAYYISNLKEIPQDELEKAIVSTFAKDFSKKVKKALLGKFKRVLRSRDRYRRTGKFPRRR